MTTQHTHWYLAQYITGGRNREKLFAWMSEQSVIPWTPLKIIRVPRADSRGTRQRINAVFPGYFFIRANLEERSVFSLRQHSAFLDFVRFGDRIKPVKPDIVDGLMKLWPDPAQQRQAAPLLNAASDTWLTDDQYRCLLRMNNTPQPETRISLLLELVSHAENHGFGG